MRLVADIHKKLGDFSLDCSFETEDLITGILGASGCGKSMTLKCIAGIERPDSGHIELDGDILYDSTRKIDIRPQDRRVGYLFQNYALFPTMTVRKNILCGLFREDDKAEKNRKYRQAVEMLGLDGLENHKPYQLSGGQQQRVALARILVSEPRMLLLDEPFSALDSYMRKSLQNELASLLESVGRQTILVTHSQREVRKMSSHLILMKGGHIIQEGKTEEVFSSPADSDCAVLLDE